jgi:MEMO1 family protein
MIDREPAVAGRFYAADRERLAADVARLLGGDGLAPRRAVGVLAPHAGYVYSGRVAGATYARVEVPARAIVLAPNHTGRGARCALWPDGAFRTPLGRVPIDAALTAALAACPLVEEDRAAHLHEHALEVQLPFLQARRPDVAIAALCLGPLSADECVALGRAVARAVRGVGALLVASSDMSHYEPAERARAHDLAALEPFLALDARGLHARVRGEDISMCGVIPATVMLAAAAELGATRAELVAYANSGDVNGDRESVVGYAGAIVE